LSKHPSKNRRGLANADSAERARQIAVRLIPEAYLSEAEGIRFKLDRLPLPPPSATRLQRRLSNRWLIIFRNAHLQGRRTHPDEIATAAARAEEHLRLLRDGDQRQDHLSHAATRLLMALTLRELA